MKTISMFFALFTAWLPASAQKGSIVFMDKAGGILLHSLADNSETVIVNGKFPAISADGSRMAFITMTGANSTNIHIYDLHKRQKLYKIPFGNASNLQWSPHGKLLLLELDETRSSSVFVLDTGTRKPVLLISNASNPSWSPDGQTVVFIRQFDLYLFHMKDGSITNLTSTDAVIERQPKFSPDGKMIAYQYQSANNVNAIYLLELSSGKRTKLIDYNSDYFSWTPEGNILFEQVEEGQPSQVAMVNTTSKEITKLTNTDRSHHWPIWLQN